MTGSTADLPIVVGIDGSSSAIHAARWGAFEAARRRVPLRLVHVYTVPRAGRTGIVGSIDKVREALDERGRAQLTEAREAVLPGFPGLTVDTGAMEWSPIPALVNESRRARMIVLGSRGLGGFTGLIVGSTAVALATHGHCPTIVVRGAKPGNPPPAEGPVVVGADGSPDSYAAVAFAFEEASMRGTSVTVVHTWSDVLEPDGTLRMHPLELDTEQIEQGESRVLAEQLAGWQEKYPDVVISRVVTQGRPVRELLRQGVGAQLIVVGSRGRGGFKGMLLGSTSQALVAHSPCPVAIVRPPAAATGTTP
jgi:nucleotide-binding universal stress UspA family protein